MSRPAQGVGTWGMTAPDLQTVIPALDLPIVINQIHYSFRGAATADYFTLDCTPKPANWPGTTFLTEYNGSAGALSLFGDIHSEILIPAGSYVTVNCFLTAPGMNYGSIWYYFPDDETPVPAYAAEPIRLQDRMRFGGVKI